MSDAVIAASVAAIVALLGYAFNNFISYKNTGRQLEHDRKEKHAERRLALRREIYLGVAAHLQDALFAVGDFAQVHVDAAKTQATWRQNAHFAAKLHLMAGPDLLVAFNEANMRVGSGILEVLRRRSQLDDTKHHMNRLLDSIKGHDAAKERAWEALRERGRAGTLDDPAKERLNKIIEGEHGAREDLAQQHDALLDSLRAMQREVLRFAQQEQLAFYPLFVQVARAARGELGEPFDAPAYELLLRKTHENATAAIERAFGPAPKPENGEER